MSDDKKEPWDGTYYGTTHDGHMIVNEEQLKEHSKGCALYTTIIVGSLMLAMDYSMSLLTV